MIELERERAKRKGTASAYTPEILLKEILEQIISGQSECDIIVVAMGNSSPDGATLVTLRVGGSMNAFETLGVLAQAQHGIIAAGGRPRDAL